MSCMCTSKSEGEQVGAMQMLRDEHRVIEKVLNALEYQLDQPLDIGFYRQCVDFLRNFTDGCHHAKEENELFPILESAGIPREGGPIGCMLSEHEQGRAYIRAIAANLDAFDQGDRSAEDAVKSTASEYIQMLRAHIFKEDNILFRMAEQALGPEEQQLMRAAFERSNEATGCASRHGSLVNLAGELSKQACGSMASIRP